MWGRRVWQMAGSGYSSELKCFPWLLCLLSHRSLQKEGDDGRKAQVEVAGLSSQRRRLHILQQCPWPPACRTELGCLPKPLLQKRLMGWCLPLLSPMGVSDRSPRLAQSHCGKHTDWKIWTSKAWPLTSCLWVRVKRRHNKNNIKLHEFCC